MCFIVEKQITVSIPYMRECLELHIRITNPHFLNYYKKVFTIHQQNIKVLDTGIVMAKNDVSPVFMIEVSELKESSYSSSSQKS